MVLVRMSALMDIRDRLLHAAARVYAETGFRGATTRRIALEAGVNEVTLFRHFGSKSRLIHEAIECSDLGAAAQPLPEEPADPRTELLTWARVHIAALRSRRSLIRTCMGEIEEHPDLLGEGSSPTAQAALQLRTYLGRLVDRGLASEGFDPIAAASMLMGTLFADAMGRDVMPDLFGPDPDQAVEHYVDLMLRAIGARMEARSH
jgi:AcrR family transcriptional regulator